MLLRAKTGPRPPSLGRGRRVRAGVLLRESGGSFYPHSASYQRGVPGQILSPAWMISLGLAPASDFKL